MTMRSETFPEIRALPLFRDMAPDAFEALMRAGYVQTFPQQVDLIAEGDPCDFLHVVVEGAVELLAGWNGRETTMEMVHPVSTFILAATIRDAPYLMSARTVGKARLVLIPSGDVRAAFDADRGFARAAVAELAQGYRRVVKSAKNIRLRTSVERLANWLLRQHGLAEGQPEFELRMEKRRLASLLGMTPENLSRAIRALRPHGVRIEGNRAQIADPAALARLAKPTPLIDDPDC